jgi:hypothetical protein
VSNITFSIGEQRKILMSDYFVCSLHHLRQYKTFGTMFGCSSEIYEFIPRICDLATSLRYPDESDTSRPPHDVAEWITLERSISGWTPLRFLPGKESWIAEQKTSAQIYKISMLIFLYTAYCTRYSLKVYFMEKVRPLVREVLPLLGAIHSSAMATTMLWPVMIIGSCLDQPSQQQELRQMLTVSRFKMRIVDRAIQLLDWVWEASDEGMLGSYRLEAQMKRHKFVFCMS